MLGIILRFEGTQGVVASLGGQHSFLLEQWTSNKAPSAGQIVEFQLSGEGIRNIAPVEIAEIAREGTRDVLRHAQGVALATYGEAGLSVTIAYGLFALLALFADTIRNVPVTLPGLVNGLSWYTINDSTANGGFGFFLVLLAILSVVVPVYRNHRTSFLAYMAPLGVELIGWYHLLVAGNEISRYANVFAARIGIEIHESSLQSITLWAWLTLLVSLFLAYQGYQRYREEGS